MKYFVFAFLAAALSLTVGCTPKLADSQLGEREKEWKEYIEPIYPGWKAPTALPPAVANEKNAFSSDNEVTVVGNDSQAFDSKQDNAAANEVEPAAYSGNADDVLTSVEEPEVSKVSYEEYVVVKDESLSAIAKKVYGDGRKYFRIYKANEDVIKNPNRIYPGMKLRIPRP